MTTTSEPRSAPPQARTSDLDLPAVLAFASLVLVVIGGIFMASYAPRRAPLGVPITLLVLAVCCIASAVAVVANRPRFAWWRFFGVFRWVLLAYVVESGMIAYVFVKNDTPGGQLAVLFGFLALWATIVAFTIGYTVAAHERSATRPTG